MSARFYDMLPLGPLPPRCAACGFRTPALMLGRSLPVCRDVKACVRRTQWKVDWLRERAS